MAKTGAVYSGRLSLFKSSAIVSNPTLAAGDVVVVRSDGTAQNIATLPSVNADDSDIVEFTLSATEMAGSAGETVTIKFVDQAGDAWEPVTVDIPLDTYRLADLPQAIWGVLTNTLTTTGSIGKLIVDYLDAAISTIAASVAATSTSLTDGNITARRWVTYTETLSGMTIPATWSKIYLTVKANADDERDSEALLQILATSGGDGGLQRINGKSPMNAGLTSGDASLTVDQGAGTVAVVISDKAMALLNVQSASFDVKYIKDGTTGLLAEGTFTIQTTETRARS
jgi:hypothetical protein